jgi:hypothetical protein
VTRERSLLRHVPVQIAAGRVSSAGPAPQQRQEGSQTLPPKRIDVAIPIVFPEYRIKVSEPVRFNVRLDKVEAWGVEVFSGYRYKGPEIFDGKIDDLGHAGVLIIRGGSPHTKGLTKYYEYGRYDAAEMGIARKVQVPDVVLGADGRPTRDSLKHVLAVISTKAGHGTPVQGAYIEAPGRFEAMLKYATTRVSLNKNPKREAYSIWTNSCLHFAIHTVEAGGIETPWYADPSPASYGEVLQEAFPDLDYDPKRGTLVIENTGNVPTWAGNGQQAVSPAIRVMPHRRTGKAAVSPR